MKKLVLFGAVIVVVILAVIVLYKQKQKEKAPLSPELADAVRQRSYWEPAFQEYWGKAAPALEFTDVNGVMRKLNDFAGKPVVLLFWATWCPPCLQEIPGLIQLRSSYDANSLAIIGISDEDSETVKDLAQNRGVNYIVAGTAGAKFESPFGNITSLPTTFFIDPNGIIRLGAVGAMSGGEVKKIAAAIRETAVAN